MVGLRNHLIASVRTACIQETSLSPHLGNITSSQEAMGRLRHLSPGS